MMKLSRISIIILGILLISSSIILAAPRPDVKTTSTTTVSMKGTLGAMMKMFGGGKPTTSVEYIQGNKSRSDRMDENGKVTNSSMIDLDREVFIEIDHKQKEYSEMTFAEFRNLLKGMGKEAEEEYPRQEPEPKVTFEVKIDRTGEKKVIAGYNTEKVVLTLTTKENQQTKSGMVVTSTFWMANEVKHYKEIMAFHKALAEKLGMMPGSGGMADALQGMIGSDPQLSEAMKKMKQEGEKLQGMPLLTESVFETWGQPARARMGAEEETAEGPEMPKSVGGLLGGFGKKLGQKSAKKEETTNASGRTVLMQSTTEVTAISDAPLDSKLFSIPAGYKKRSFKEQ
ncbi:MAG: DUF4412 domain-containing protein [candidate division KSB1 bacterium]|nr:DUF4412 domain-containing protein [candidate division KSB1 bacterium]